VADLDAALRQIVADAIAPVLAEVRDLRRLLEQRESEAPWETRAELAKRLQVHCDTIDRRCEPGGDIERRKIGRAVRVRLVPKATDAEVSAATVRAIG
jgi:hypothetical protein